MNWLNIDSNLPELQNAFDSNIVKQLFAQPNTSTCRRQSTNYVPATRCVTTHVMELERMQEETGMSQTIGVVEANRTGLSHSLFTEDAALPGLTTATNVEHLQSRFDAASNELGTLQSVTPLRYKPNSRCSIRYQVEGAEGQDAYFGKVLAEGDGTQLARSVNSLYQASLENAALPRIPKPLAFWSDLQLLVQASVPGMELHDAAFDSDFGLETRLNWMQDAGRASATRHALRRRTHPDL